MSTEITIQLCYLTDGYEMFASQMLSTDEIKEKNLQAKKASDGIFYWTPACIEIAKRPQHRNFRHIFSY